VSIARARAFMLSRLAKNDRSRASCSSSAASTRPRHAAARGRLHLRPECDQALQQLLEVRAGHRRAARPEAHRPPLDAALHQEAVQLAVVLDVGFRLAPLRAVQRRLRDEDVPAVDELGQLPVEEREQPACGCATRPRPRRS